ncbi:hypothetical protein E2562_038449 [Oryza meyeriana var. granulata]|uniref:Uncharacterized protein n=1 Tax=Oryza meyeriana var. granulata TaxID=110450 RepID=A0A6G1E7J6_9ORYZ|nr:hypothetical protein E2562_038449 [Oryza meyeriana var. granulata]
MEARWSKGEKKKEKKMASRPSSPPQEETTRSEEEEQQMERFYALVANVRAMRAMFKEAEAALPSCNDDDGSAEQRKKRPRAAPWRPAFEMADFECDGTTTTEAKTKGQDYCNKANAAAAEDEGEVVEENQSPSLGLGSRRCPTTIRIDHRPA